MYWLGLLKTCFSKAFMQVMSDAPARLTDSQFCPWRVFLRGQILCSFLVLLHTSAGYMHSISGRWVQDVQWHAVCGTVIVHTVDQEYKTEFLDVSHHFESSFLRAGKRRRKSV